MDLGIGGVDRLKVRIPTCLSWGIISSNSVVAG